MELCAEVNDATLFDTIFVLLIVRTRAPTYEHVTVERNAPCACA